MAQFPSTTSASDVWNITDIYRAVAGGNWPPSVVPDDYFEYVTTLLPANGANGAQNNTFLDSSTNNYTITRNGNTTQGTFSPYGANWSAYFNGSSDYLSTAYNNDFDISTPTSFTVEGWIYRDGTGDADWRMVGGSATSSGFFGGRGTLSLGLGRSTIAWDLESSSNAYSLNTWTHVAYVRNSSNVLSIFANGIRVATTTSSANFGLNGGALQIAAERGGQFLGGYISNVRVVRGGPIYDPTASTITVPTAPFPSTEGFLTCQSNRFIDNASGNFPITINGTPKIQRFSPFSPTAAYSASVIGGSAYFDGSGDNLVTSGTGSFNPRSTFTVEFWTYPITNSTVTWINSNTNNNFYVETNAGTLYVGDGSINTISTTPPVLNQWTHVLLSFDGTTYRLFYNGVSQATSTSLLASNTISAFRVGQKNDATRPFSGYINDLRVLVGTALYTSAFTPPTAPLTAVSGTSLLLSATNAGIIDNSMLNNFETVGNAQISTSVVKYGTGSVAFDGTGDYLINASNRDVTWGTGNFTIEGWFYWNSLASESAIMWGNGVGWTFYIYPANKLQWGRASPQTPANLLTGSTTLATGQWYHIAVTRNSNTVTLWVNGVSDGTVTDSANYSAAGRLAIGISHSSGYFNGYMDDVRITKGVARYTTTFTPPTAAFPTL